jgi:hypothetical protein
MDFKNGIRLSNRQRLIRLPIAMDGGILPRKADIEKFDELVSTAGLSTFICFVCSQNHPHHHC